MSLMRKGTGDSVPINLISDYRNEMYGLCALWIVGLHGVGLFGIDLSFGIPILEPIVWFFRQNLAVDVFLILSGMSCYYSYSTKPDAGAFIRRRLSRIWPALLVTYGISWGIFVVAGRRELPWLLWNSSFLPFFTEGNLNGAWYFSFIMLLYFCFPYIYEFVFSGVSNERMACVRAAMAAIVAMLVYWLIHKYAFDFFMLIEGGFARIPVFILGSLLGYLAKRNYCCSHKAIAILLILSLVWGGGIFLVYRFSRFLVVATVLFFWGRCFCNAVCCGIVCRY